MTQHVPPQKPATAVEQVARRAPPGSSVVDVRERGEGDLEVAGRLDLFIVTPPSAHPPPADSSAEFSVVVVVGGVGGTVLDDKAAILSEVGKTTRDARKLARVALLLNGRDDTPLLAPATDGQRQAGVTAPAIVKDALEFWIWSGAPSRNLYRCSVDLATAKLTLAQTSGPPRGVVAEAVAAIQSGNTATIQFALEALAPACTKDPDARKVLFDTLANHPREDVRAAAAYSAPKCGHDAFAPLMAALEHDPSRLVRGKAALALAELGDKAALPALRNAATSDISTAANLAIQQLEKK